MVLAASMRDASTWTRSAALRARLYERVAYEHDAASELGERYRVANDAAHGFVRRLERDYVGPRAIRGDAGGAAVGSSTRVRRRSCGSAAPPELVD